MLHRIRVTVRNVLAATGALVLVVCFTPLVPWMAKGLSHAWTDTATGTLIVLGGSSSQLPGPPPNLVPGLNSYWRGVHTIALWRERHFRNVLLSGRYSDQTLKPLLLQNGIPESAILVEGGSDNTRQNALYSKSILQSLPGPYVLLTSDYHTWRASRCFAREGVKVETLGAPDILKRGADPMERVPCFLELCREYAKIGYYKLRGWI